MKSDKELIFERMGLSSPKLTMQQPVTDAYVPSSAPMDQIFNILDREGYFPIFDNLGRVQFVETESNPEEYEKFRKSFGDAWRKISLPWGNNMNEWDNEYGDDSYQRWDDEEETRNREDDERNRKNYRSDDGMKQFLRNVEQWERIYGDKEHAFYFLQSTGKLAGFNDALEFKKFLQEKANEINSLYRGDERMRNLMYPKFIENINTAIQLIDYGVDRINNHGSF